MSRNLTRRELGLTGLGLAAGLAGCTKGPETARPASPVAVLKAPLYSMDIAALLMRGARECGLDVRGKRVLLKPNLVEFDRSTAVNTDVAVLAAAVEVCERLGAAQVLIGEGPGHRRDTWELASEAGYRKLVPRFDQRFVDLNRDDVTAVKAFGDVDFYLPNAALRADLIISLAKMKTHHWVGATLSMKNYFGLAPGSVYGWPKNQLHYNGIPRSIVELTRLFPRSFAIVDGIVGMEGNGPIQGQAVNSGLIVMGADRVAVDATCCRLMSIDPAKIEYLAKAQLLGNSADDRIEQRGELVKGLVRPFALINELRHLRQA